MMLAYCMSAFAYNAYKFTLLSFIYWAYTNYNKIIDEETAGPRPQHHRTLPDHLENRLGQFQLSLQGETHSR